MCIFCNFLLTFTKNCRKYEQKSSPFKEYCYMTENPYSKEEVSCVSSWLFALGGKHISLVVNLSFAKLQVVHMERDVLKCLNFEMGDPTTKTFLRFNPFIIYFFCYFIIHFFLISMGSIHIFSLLMTCSYVDFVEFL